MLQSVADSLRVEVRRHWGSIGYLEGKMKRRPGYLAKMCQGIHHTTIRLLLEVLEALDVDFGAFFTQALDLPPRPDIALDRLARQFPPETATADRLKRRLERTAALLANSPMVSSDEISSNGQPAGWERLVHLLEGCRWPRQRKQLLRSSTRFHDPSFLLAYLQYLERRSPDNLRETSGILVTLVLYVLPQIPAGLARQNLICRTLALWAFCQYRLGRHRNAVFVLRQALNLSRLSKLRYSTARILEMGAQILEAHGAVEAALAFLDEAQILYLDLDCNAEIQRVLAARSRLRKILARGG